MKNLFLSLLCCVGLLSCSTSTVVEESISVADSLHLASNTELVLVNNSEDSVLVFLTLSGYPASDSSKYIQNVNGIFGIKQTGLVGSFYLGAKDTVAYSSYKWFSGNVSFGAQPINCFTKAWPTGINPFEFNLNDGQESIDISAIGGVNCILHVDLLGGPAWMASHKYPDVRCFHNDTLYGNTGKVGVFPYGCTNCTDTLGRQPCQVPSAIPNTAPICNPTRAAGEHGGIVIVTFEKFVK